MKREAESERVQNLRREYWTTIGEVKLNLFLLLWQFLAVIFVIIGAIIPKCKYLKHS